MIGLAQHPEKLLFGEIICPAIVGEDIILPRSESPQKVITLGEFVSMSNISHSTEHAEIVPWREDDILPYNGCAIIVPWFRSTYILLYLSLLKNQGACCAAADMCLR